MDLRELLAIELHLLVPHHKPLTFDIAADEFPTFFDRNESPEALRNALRDLHEQEIVSSHDAAIDFSKDGRRWAHQKMLEFEFPEGRDLAARSAADQAFLRDMRESHGYVGMTDAAQRSYLVDTLRTLSAPALDAGCGDGELTALLQEQTGLSFFGIDSSPDLVCAATDAHPGVSFAVHDLTNLDTYPDDFASVLFADSLYFAPDPHAVLSAVAPRLGENGGIVILYSLYAGPGVEPVHLSPSDTPVMKSAELVGMKCAVTDFSSSEDSMWQAKLDALERLRPNYYSDRMTYLYYSRWKECALLAHMVSEKRSARYGFLLRTS
jgi:SAM-dependent methyltransferase